jgi:hypothetical protein
MVQHHINKEMCTVSVVFPLFCPTPVYCILVKTHNLLSTCKRLIDFVIFIIINEELHRLYSAPSIIRMIKSRRMRWAGHVARMEEKRNAYRMLMGKPEGERLLGRPRRRWVDNIRMDLGEIGGDGVDCIDLAQDRDHWRALVNTVMNLRVP